MPDPGAMAAGEFKGQFETPAMEEPPTPRQKVYNPRRMRWEWSDTGKPVDGPSDAKKPATGRCGGILSIEKAGDMLMPYGTHTGLKLSEVPADYLKYCLREHKLTPRLAAAMALVVRSNDG